MPTKYLVLRAQAPLVPTLEVFGVTARVPEGNELSIVAIPGHEYDAGTLRADPQNAVVMDAETRLALIEPTEKTDGASANVTRINGLSVPMGLIAVRAHASRCSGAGVKVAVLDTGIDKSHPAFLGKNLKTRDFTGTGNDPSDVRDDLGHGTHCAATICGNLVAGTRLGVAPGVSDLIIGKVVGPDGGTLEMLLRALYWAIIDEKADVVSMSLGYDLPGNVARLVARGMDTAVAANLAMRQQRDMSEGIRELGEFLRWAAPHAVFAAATGNESKRPGYSIDAGLPAVEFLAVGAVGLTGGEWKVAPFSNGRAKIVAPGVDVVSARAGGGLISMSGTSMATPHVAGVAALWLEHLRQINGVVPRDAVAARLLATAAAQSGADRDAVGAGLVQSPP